MLNNQKNKFLFGIYKITITTKPELQDNGVDWNEWFLRATNNCFNCCIRCHFFHSTLENRLSPKRWTDGKNYGKSSLLFHAYRIIFHVGHYVYSACRRGTLWFLWRWCNARSICINSHTQCIFHCIAMVLQQKRRFVMSFKTRIKELRARYDLTQEDLAKKVGVRRETILYLEKGKYNPSLKLAYEISKVLKTTIDDLFIFEKWQ